MLYILILVFATPTSYGATVTMQEFSSKASCDSAKNSLIYTMRATNSASRVPLVAYCTPK